MLNGLDLFSGYGGISLALSEWVRPVAYCEIERYAQGILLSRMADGALPVAPIWDDVTTLDGKPWRSEIDIIYGGFPCQDISSAGLGKGLAGERSGLFREIVRLAKEIKPTFLFLENVPAIRTRGLDAVSKELTNCGYDLRWTSLSAAEIGAPHKRERWFLLAKHTQVVGLQTHRLPKREEAGESEPRNACEHFSWFTGDEVKPALVGVADGCAYRVDRIKSLGNGVVPFQVQTAFKELMGLS